MPHLAAVSKEGAEPEAVAMVANHLQKKTANQKLVTISHNSRASELAYPHCCENHIQTGITRIHHYAHQHLKQGRFWCKILVAQII